MDHDPVVASLHPLPRLLQADAVTPDPILNPTQVHLAEAIAALDRARSAVELATAPGPPVVEYCDFQDTEATAVVGRQRLRIAAKRKTCSKAQLH